MESSSLIIGEKEESDRNISLRSRTKGDEGSVEIDEFLNSIKLEIENKL